MLASISWPFAFAVTPILTAALIQPFLPRVGRWLLYSTIPLISAPLIPAGVVGWVETLQGGRRPYDTLGLTLFFAWTTAPIMLIWCNTELVRGLLRVRRARALDRNNDSASMKS